MARLGQQIIKGEKGQALPIVLILLVLGGLLIVPGLSYAATSLNAGQVVKENVSGIFAADAGVEYALWHIETGSKMPKKLPENVNQLEVKIKAKRKKGTYTLYYGELTKSGKHSDYLDVSGEMVWDEWAEAYQYTITVTWQAEKGKPTIHLEGVGVRLPLGYSYESGSAASFDDNLSIDEPIDTPDGVGAHMLNWELPPPHPAVSEGEPIATQSFYVTVTGEGGQSGDYAWVLAKRHDVGEVGEIIGRLYRIEAEATVPGKHGEKIIKVEAFVLKEEAGEAEEGEGWDEEWEEEAEAIRTHIISWEITHTKEKKGK